MRVSAFSDKLVVTAGGGTGDVEGEMEDGVCALVSRFSFSNSPSPSTNLHVASGEPGRDSAVIIIAQHFAWTSPSAKTLKCIGPKFTGTSTSSQPMSHATTAWWSRAPSSLNSQFLCRVGECLLSFPRPDAQLVGSRLANRRHHLSPVGEKKRADSAESTVTETRQGSSFPPPLRGGASFSRRTWVMTQLFAPQGCFCASLTS